MTEYQGHGRLAAVAVCLQPGEGCLRVGPMVRPVGKVPGGPRAGV